MKIRCKTNLTLSSWIVALVCLVLFLPDIKGQDNSVVIVHADKSSGYGVAWGGPQNSPDMIVTALHLVAGKSNITVVWQGKTTTATVEKIYMPSDLALLKLKTPLGIRPLTLYSGEPPWDTNINFWEIPVTSIVPSKKTTILEGRTSLANISPENQPEGLSKALCSDGDQFYPGLNTSVINFMEPNIRKAHSGSPLTYGDKILGMVDGGARLVGGKPCVWAIPASDFNKLYNQGTVPSNTLASCDSPGSSNKFMYSGIRSDNPMLSAEEVEEAKELDQPIDISSNKGDQLKLHHNYSMSFAKVYETLFEEEKTYLSSLFHPEDSITLEDLLNLNVNLFVEENTGVSVIIPTQCKLSASQDGFGSYNTTTSPGGTVSLSFYISTNESMQEGMIALNSFKEFVQTNGQSIQPIANNVAKVNENSKYYTEYFEKKTNDKKGNTRAIFFADLTINDGDFLAVTLNVTDWRLVAKNPSEKLFFYLMETCAVLSDFTIY